MKHTARTPFMPWRTQYSRRTKGIPSPTSVQPLPSSEQDIFSIEKICTEVLKSLHERIRKKKPLIALDIDLSTPRLVRGNGAQLENLLHLLLSNVVAFSAESSITLSVVTRRFTPEGAEVLFSIERLNNSASMPVNQVIEGSIPPGLSFSICSSVIASAGGRLNVKKLEEGLEISFYIPYSTDDISDETKSRTTPVLLVEDNDMNRKILASSLEHGGYSVRSVASGQEALDILFDEEWSVILMDIQMPGMDGLQTTLAIRAAEELKNMHTPIVAVTAYARPEDRERCLAAGMEDYLAKPVKLETLLSTVEKVTGISSFRKSAVKGTDANSAILSFTEGDKELARKVVGEFLLLAPALLNSVREAFDQKDWQALRLLVHRLKGNLAYFGECEAFLLSEALHKEMENLSEDEVASLLLRLLSETGHLMEELASEEEPAD